MRKKVIATAILVGAILVSFLVVHLVKVYDRQLNYHKIATYHIFADKLDLKTVNADSQKITKVYKKGEYYELQIKVNPGFVPNETIKLGQGKLNQDVARYLKPTDKIQSDSKVVKDLVNKIINKKNSVIDIAEAASSWTSRNIEYDNEHAFNVVGGYNETKSAKETIWSKTGSCYENVNVFAAIMRSVGVPTKYVLGHVFGAAYLAWAECYVDGHWVSVDPSTGDIGLDNRYIKLFEGLDYPEFKTVVTDIGIGVDRLE